MTIKPTYEELEKRLAELEQSESERKRTREALGKRILALTMPLYDADNVNFEDLFNLDDIQRLQDEFACATGVAALITQPDGTPITGPSNFCRLCRDFIRKSPKGIANCHKSDSAIGHLSTDGLIIQPCLSVGLWDACAMISVGGKHLANWLIGQVRDETQTEDKIREYAREIEVDEQAAVEAFREVPTLSREKFERIARMLLTIANQLSAVAYQNVQQARFIAGIQIAENALKEREAQLRTLIRTIPDLVWLKDPQGVYLSCNSRVERFLGATEKNIIGKTDFDFMDNELAGSFREYDRRAMQHGRLTKVEEAVVFADDGHREILETLKTPMFSSSGELIGVLAIGRDITERKRAEQEREVLIAAIEQAGEMITLTDSNGIIRYVNSTFERLTGFHREEVIGQSPRFFDSDKPEEATFQEKWEAVSSGKSWTGRSVQRRKDGTCFTVDASVSPIRDASGEIVNHVSVKRDITESLRLEQQFRQAQKMDSVGRLAGGVAHDYNNMLNVILGNAQLATRKLSLDDPLQPHLRAIIDAGNRSSALTKQLLAFARKQTISPKILDLNEAIEGMLKMIRRLIGEHIDLVWRPKTNAWQVKMDPSQIDQILVNLCVNARDAVSDVGKIIIETETVTLDEDCCADHAGFSPGPFVRLSVSDNGSGMDREVIEHIFEPFFTTKAAGHGSGLGLATIYGIVKQNNGFINVYSEPGRGTTIKVYLPRHEGAANIGDSEDISEPPLSNGETALLVEDEAEMMEVTRVMLESLDYNVIAAAGPKEAIDFSKQHVGKIDVLITDVVMPQMNGRQLAEQIHALVPDVKILFMSGYTADIIAHQGVLDEGVNFIQKPFSMYELAAKVRMILDNGKS